MARIMVTGGAGFIGSNYVEHHLKEHPNDEIVVFDKLTYAGRMENLREFEENPNFSFVKGDICNKKDVSKAMQGIDEVINFAAESHVDHSIKDPDSFIKTDVFGAHNLLEEARKNNVKKFVQISTDEVYGEVMEGESDENYPLMPRNPYSASKAAADRLAYSYYATYGLPVVITRSSNNYGKKHYPEKIIPLFITNLIRGKKVPVYGDGMQVRDWLYVMDNCEGIDIVRMKGKNGEAYNIGAGNELPNIELTKIILKELGKGEEMIQHVEDRLGHDRRYALNFDKIKNLGWEPKTNLEEGLKETVKWYKENEEWWNSLVK